MCPVEVDHASGEDVTAVRYVCVTQIRVTQRSDTNVAFVIAAVVENAPWWEPRFWIG